MINKNFPSLKLLANPDMHQLMRLFFFAFFVNVFYGQDVTENSAQSSIALQIDYSRQEGVSITTKQIDYYVKVKNLTSKPKTILVSALSVGSNESSLISTDVEFKLINSQGASISSIELRSASDVDFILRTLKKDNFIS